MNTFIMLNWHLEDSHFFFIIFAKQRLSVFVFVVFMFLGPEAGSGG